MNTEIKRPVLRYHGGKWILAPWIISHFPKHKVYVEPFGGGGSILMRKDRSYAEIYNDVWDTVVNVFQILRDPKSAVELERLLRLTPYSRMDFEKTAFSNMESVTDPLEKARMTIFRSFSGFRSGASNSKCATGFRSNSNRSGTTPAHDWVNYPNMVKHFTARLQGVVIENRDYKQIIAQHDSRDTLFYLDPPYVHRTRSARYLKTYEFELTDSDHEDMLLIVKKVSGFCVISGYDNAIYNDHLKGWSKVTKDALADGAKKKIGSSMAMS